MRTTSFIWIVLSAICAEGVFAQAAKEVASSALRPAVVTNAVPVVNSSATDWLALSNRTVKVIAAVRGVKAEAVQLKAAYAPELRPFEIVLAGATNLFAEAEALSKELGAGFTVVADATSDDGTVRTNRTFLDGAMKQLVLKESPSMQPGLRRLYVRPQSSPLAPPAAKAIRLAQ